MRKYKSIIIAALIFLFLGFLFYRYDFLPREAKKNCNQYAMNNVAKKFPSFTDSRTYDQSEYDGLYLKCLREKGL